MRRKNVNQLYKKASNSSCGIWVISFFTTQDFVYYIVRIFPTL